MRRSSLPASWACLLLLSGIGAANCAQTPAKPAPKPGPARGWLNWRGPLQTGVSLEKGLPAAWTPGGKGQLWEIKLAGRGTPVIANGHLYAWGYRGEGPDLREVLLCADAATGKTLWEKHYTDYLSDVIYDRYSIGAPAVDPETGNVYLLNSPGTFACYTPAGKLVWERSTFEEIGRLSFPNGRTGSPMIDDDLVIIRGITGNWGAQGQASDRFYAFDKKTGDLVWASTPGDRPKENSFALPVLTWLNGKRVLYSGLGDGSVAAVNARTGEPLWRFPLSGGGGVNPTVLLHKGHVMALHDAENLDSNEQGRMVAIKVGTEPNVGTPGPVVLDKSAEVWRNELSSFSSSPVLVGDRVYVVTKQGDLACVDANNGKELWKQKLGLDQLHASPTFGDGKLYIPMQSGDFFIIRPSDAGAQILARVKLEGRCLGAPAIANGRVYVFTTEKLYCFGSKTGSAAPVPAPAASAKPKPGPATALQIVPSEVLMQPGQKAKFVIRGIDANGLVTGTFPAARAKWVSFIPPTAAVRAEMDGAFNPQGELVAGSKPSAGAFEATIENLKGYMRGRVLPSPPQREDFNASEISVAHATEAGVKFAYPPLPWIGARFRWEVRDLEGEKVLAKTLDNPLFQRAMTFIGHPALKNYTVEADVMSDGNRRVMSSVGLINQRYIISLLGNAQQIQVASNDERLKVSAPFAWRPKVWYRLRTRVDVGTDGNGTIRAKAWPRGEAEPAAWTIEVPHKEAHTRGAPGLYGFSPQSLFRVYIDNVSVTPNSGGVS